MRKIHAERTRAKKIKSKSETMTEKRTLIKSRLLCMIVRPHSEYFRNDFHCDVDKVFALKVTLKRYSYNFFLSLSLAILLSFARGLKRYIYELPLFPSAFIHIQTECESLFLFFIL